MSKNDEDCMAKSPEPVVKKTELLECTNRIDDAIQTCAARLKVLRSALQPIRRPSMDAVQNGEKKSAEHSPLINWMDETHADIVDIIEGINDILDTIEV